MSELVATNEIERIVGAKRFLDLHVGRLVPSGELLGRPIMYILHSQRCLDSGIDLRKCEYSLALDRGGNGDGWPDYGPTTLQIEDGFLYPDISLPTTEF